MNNLFPGIDSIYQLISNPNEKVGNNIFLSTKNNLDEIEILTYSELLILIDKFHSYELKCFKNKKYIGTVVVAYSLESNISFLDVATNNIRYMRKYQKTILPHLHSIEEAIKNYSEVKS